MQDTRAAVRKMVQETRVDGEDDDKNDGCEQFYNNSCIMYNYIYTISPLNTKMCRWVIGVLLHQVSVNDHYCVVFNVSTYCLRPAVGCVGVRVFSHVVRCRRWTIVTLVLWAVDVKLLPSCSKRQWTIIIILLFSLSELELEWELELGLALSWCVAKWSLSCYSGCRLKVIIPLSGVFLVCVCVCVTHLPTWLSNLECYCFLTWLSNPEHYSLLTRLNKLYILSGNS